MVVHMRWALALFVLVLATVVTGARSDVFRWQDENGKWHFGDKPPQGVESEDLTEEHEQAAAVAGPDLAARLTAQLSPGSPLERATLAVVTVETALSKGAGFFVSPSGHLLTNRHVVRPTDTSYWAERTATIDELEQEFQGMKAELEASYAPLREMEHEMEALESAIKSEGSSSKRNELKERLRRTRAEYEPARKDYYKSKRKLQDIKREFDTARREFDVASNATIVSSTFKVHLKNGEVVRARLVAQSDRIDLALLKVDNVTTPWIEPFASGTLTQGTRLFAVGSPLGMHDAMTAGVATTVNPVFIATDAKVFPGSSGGPLLTESGQVVGINTLKLSDRDSGEGFGLAIPFARARAEFDW